MTYLDIGSDSWLLALSHEPLRKLTSFRRMSFRLPVATHQFLFLGQEDGLPSIAEHKDITSEISMKLPSKRYTMAHVSCRSALPYLAFK
jgi:hypothetical protein